MKVYWQGTSPLHSENPQGLAIYSVYSYREEELSRPRNGCMERWKEKMTFALFKFSIALQIVCLLPLSATEEDVSKSPTMWICPFLLLILSYIFGGNVSSWYKYVLVIISSWWTVSFIIKAFDSIPNNAFWPKIYYCCIISFCICLIYFPHPFNISVSLSFECILVTNIQLDF